jgi:ubiquinone/menaquinone biosynthesis C-methylase UbiE
VSDYVVKSALEIEALAIQARVWESCAEALLSKIGVKSNWACVDLACGPVGILPLLARRVGRQGRVVGVEQDPNIVIAAREIMGSAGREDIMLVEGDVRQSGLERGSFDLVHGRCLLGHLPNPSAMLLEMIELAKPGGVVLVQEPDHSSWNFYPPIAEWPRLLEIGEQAFASAGIEINIGRRAFQLLRQAGLEDVRIEACVLAFQDNHPYMAMALRATEVLRPVMLKAQLTTPDELDRLVREIEKHIAKPDTSMISFTIVQVWGRRRT